MPTPTPYLNLRPFPLTPALSRRERGNVSQRSKCCCVPVGRTRNACLPLPAGEGWGEGERRGQSSELSTKMAHA